MGGEHMGNGAKPKKAFGDASGNDAEWRRILIDRIEYRLAVACGQHERIEDAMLRSIAAWVNDTATRWAVPWRDIWREVRVCNGRQHNFAPYIDADLKRRQEEKEARVKPLPLTAQQARMITTHLPLARKYAGSIAKGNQVLFSELEELGLRVLEEEARNYDLSRGVPFGAYARHRLHGAMLDHAVLN